MRPWPSAFLLMAIALSGCTTPEPVGVLSWHSPADVERVLAVTADLTEDPCDGLVAHDDVWTSEDILSIEYAFAPWSSVRAYRQPVTPFPDMKAWLLVEYPQGDDIDGALDAARDTLNLLSTGATDAQIDELAAQEGHYGTVEAIDPDGAQTPPALNQLFLQEDPGWTWDAWLSDTFDGEGPQEQLTDGPWTAHVRSNECALWIRSHFEVDGFANTRLVVTETGDLMFEQWFTHDETVEETDVRRVATEYLRPLDLQLPHTATFHEEQR